MSVNWKKDSIEDIKDLVHLGAIDYYTYLNSLSIVEKLDNSILDNYAIICDKKVLSLSTEKFTIKVFENNFDVSHDNITKEFSSYEEALKYIKELV